MKTIELNHCSDKPSNSRPKQESSFKKRVFLVSEAKCSFCQGAHKIHSCQEFLKLSASQRLEKIKDKKLCINCINVGHFISECKAGMCKHCRRKHNTLLHFENTQEALTSEPSDA